MVFGTHLMEANVLQRFAESLEVYDLSLTQELQRFDDIRIVCQIDQAFIGASGLLLCCALVSTTSVFRKWYIEKDMKA